MKAIRDPVRLRTPFNLALRRGETLTLITCSRREGKRRVILKRDRFGRVRIEEFDHHGQCAVIELDVKGEVARLVGPGPIHPSETDVMVPLVLDAVAQCMRGALLEYEGELYPPNVE
jgi:hypothetical protein